MPRYYIDTSDEVTFDIDEEGQELSGPQALRCLVRRTLGAMVKHEARHRPEMTFSAAARDESGNTVLTGRITIAVQDHE